MCGGLLCLIEMPRVDIPLNYPQLFHPPKITWDQWCTGDVERNCDSGDCIMCEKAFEAGASIGRVLDKEGLYDTH
jgi:hypothetical protein